MNLHAMGMFVPHEDNFMINRPDGSGDNLLIIFKSEARVWRDQADIADGRAICENNTENNTEYNDSQVVHTGSFIIYTKNRLQKYGANSKSYMNHYVHFNSIDEQFFIENDIWTDRPGYIQNIEEVENLLRLISREQISESRYSQENISMLLQLLFRKIGENQCEEPSLGIESSHIEELTMLRSEMYSTPGRFNRIADMASYVNLSLSHFQALYHQCFAVSCYEDLLNAKMNAGKAFLRNKELAIREIASLCGYESDTCFMRCFKKREGMTPTEYRNKHITALHENEYKK